MQLYSLRNGIVPSGMELKRTLALLTTGIITYVGEGRKEGDQPDLYLNIIEQMTSLFHPEILSIVSDVKARS